MPGLDFNIDPATGDLIDSDDGAFESVDSATPAVQMALKHHYNAWWGDPAAGSQLHLLRDQGDGVAGREFLEVEVRRALEPLIAAGYIAELDVVVTRPKVGALKAELSYRDLKSGEALELVLSPFGG
jgi:phage gp46-like protein